MSKIAPDPRFLLTVSPSSEILILVGSCALGSRWWDPVAHEERDRGHWKRKGVTVLEAKPLSVNLAPAPILNYTLTNDWRLALF